MFIGIRFLFSTCFSRLLSSLICFLWVRFLVEGVSFCPWVFGHAMLVACYLAIPTYFACLVCSLHFVRLAGPWLCSAVACLPACLSSFCCLPSGQVVWVCETWWLRYGTVVVFCNLLRYCT